MIIINSAISIIKHFTIVSIAIVLSLFSPAKHISTNKNNVAVKPTITVVVTSIPTINVIQRMADSKQILVNLEKALNVNAPITDKWNSINWLAKNKEILPLMGQGFILGINGTSVVGKYDNYSLATNIKDITEDALKPLQNTVDEFFLSNGFQKDNYNTYHATEYYLLIFKGYTKGDLKCLITLEPQSSLIGNFFCGIVDQTRLAWRKELTSAINTANDSNLVINVNNLLGNYAQGSVSRVSGEGGGAGWYAVKINGQWKEVSRGQNMSPESCKSLVQQYNFPKEILVCITPTPAGDEYRLLNLSWCRIIIYNLVAEEKNCLVSKIPEIAKVGEECQKALGESVNCRNDLQKNLISCSEQCINSGDRQTCVNNCTKDKSCLPMDYQTPKQTYLDLISKYCK
jgi:hypothetical protein